jgi:GT2 family glycosyltransferase/glycosyltransferase involved in cell wall biosynthesis
MDEFKVRGFLDGLEGAYIVGWAFGDGLSNCAITVVGSDDHVIATGIACVDRPDLRSVGNGRSNIAFRIPLHAIPNGQLVRVLADGVEIDRSPVRVGAGNYDGHVSFDACFVNGWVTERVNQFVPPLITVVDKDGNEVMRCQSESDPADDDLFSPARFSGELNDTCFGRGELRLDVLADGIKFAEGFCNLSLVGFIEAITPHRCAGWLVSPDAPHRSFKLDVWRNGVLAAKGRCAILRSDVQARYPDALRVGFDISLPADSAEPLGFTTMSVCLSGLRADVFEGPYCLGGKAALVQAARSVSRIALNTDENVLTSPERAILHAAMADFLGRARLSDQLVFDKHSAPFGVATGKTRLNIIIPIYRGLSITKACIDSVIECRSTYQDRIILINDRSPEAGMADMLDFYRDKPNLFISTNTTNLGFVKSVNRGLAFCDEGDVILLNSDTKVFPGGFDALWTLANTAPDVGTVTAISNNATIFSYPHVSLRTDRLHDISWEELAAIALERNEGLMIDVPTGHGFCMLIKAELLHRVGKLDEIFGRGYGEENDFCARAADLGYRNVAAPAVLVEHRESISFVGDKSALLTTNLAILNARYPEYTPIVMEVERRDDLRVGRWRLDGARLARASEKGGRFALVVCHGLGGGSHKALTDIEDTVGYGGAERITLSCRDDGYMELSVQAPCIQAVFAPDETAQLFALLSRATVSLVVVHQVLGFSAAFLDGLRDWVATRHGVFYAHDFFPLCPRVTMIDAVERFCNIAPVEVCARCVSLSGWHEAARAESLDPALHREHFGIFLAAFKHIVAPSQNAAEYYRRAYPALTIEAVPHPSPPIQFPTQPRLGTNDEIILFGAIGPHKGSAELLEIAHLARLTHPHLRFTVIGYTNRDEELLNIGNVSITGRYKEGALPDLVRRVRGRLALFLSVWPETFSYTLTEAVRLGFIPLVPDIGAPAERVRAAGYGAIFEFPIAPSNVLQMITALSEEAGKGLSQQSGEMAGFSNSVDSIARTREIFGLISVTAACQDEAAEDDVLSKSPLGRGKGHTLSSRTLTTSAG